MNKKQITVTWVAVLLLVILLGLKTGTSYRLSEIERIGGPRYGNTVLDLYGTLILSSENAGRLHFLLWFGTYKYHLMLATALVSGALVYSLIIQQPKTRCLNVQSASLN